MDDAPTATESAPAVLDRAAALTLVGGDAQLLGELATLFLAECPRWLADMHASIRLGKAGQLKHTAHALRGSAGVFAAPGTLGAAGQLEAMGGRGDLSGAAAALTVLERELDRFRLALADWASPILVKPAIRPLRANSEVSA